MQHVLFIVFTAFAVSFALSFALKKLSHSFFTHDCKGAFSSIYSLIDAAAKPCQILIWLVALIYSLEALAHHFEKTQLVVNLGTIRALITMGFATYVILQWKKKLEIIWKEEKHIEGKSSLEKATIDAIGRFVSFLILFFSFLTSLQIMGLPIQSFLAFGAVGAAGVAWASTDIIKNFFGGFMIHLMRPFAVGDWINSPEKDIEGTVEEIGWYQTQIRTFDKRPIYVPNGLFPAIVLRNPSRMSNRRILSDIGLRYDDMHLVEPIVKDIENMLKKHPAIDTTRILMVHFVAFGSFSLNINVYCFTKTTDWVEWRRQQQDVFLKIAAIIDGHGAKIAFPTQTLQISQEEAAIVA